MSALTLSSRRWRLLSSAASWTLIALLLNLPWEIAQLRLYTIPLATSATQVAFAVAHCTVGDVVLATASFVVAAVALGDSSWPLSHPWRGGIIVVLLGVAYTAYTEWHSVYQAGYWGYTPSMPLVFGIGLAPLLQWVFIPVCAVSIIRVRRTARQVAY